jgi:hypothetical protein
MKPYSPLLGIGDCLNSNTALAEHSDLLFAYLFGSVLESDCYRDIKVAVFVKLGRQLEIAKIEEIKNIPIINVLDPARPPVRRSYPSRRAAALAALIVSLVLSVTYTGFNYQGRKALRDLRIAIFKQHHNQAHANSDDNKEQAKQT